MARYSLKKRLFSVAMAAVLTTSTIYVMPSVTVKAEKGEGTVKAKRSFDSNYDAQNAYSGDDLGCTYTKEKTTFKVWSPLATKVVLCRYEKGNGGSVIEEKDMTKGDKGVWSITIDGDIVNTYYTYKVTANGETKEAVDIYAKAAGVNGDRAMVVDLDSTDPEDWDKDYKREKTNLSDINVWEVHIRDFSIDVSSGVSEENRGKYKAFTEHTTVNGKGKVASCVDYLKQLGVTHVQILPMYDYGSTDSGSYCVDEGNVSNNLSSNYNWGYDPENYNVPEGSYSSNPYDGNVRITEMKEMIQALHDAGIKVIMDVVYNHTYDTADSNFNKIMPDYYYKLNGDLTYNNQSGCGNATRSQSAMFRKFMIDSVTYWADEYNLDGFRFDLMGIHDVTTMNQIRKALDSKFGEDTIVMYGEGWTATSPESDGAWKGNEAQMDDGIGFFNDQIRDSIKGDKEYNGTIGYVQTNYQDGGYVQGDPGNPKWPDNLFGGIMGSVGKSGGEWWMWRPFWSKSSNCSLNYTSAHDDLTLWDKFFQTGGTSHSNDFDSTADQYIRMNKMTGAIINISKGGTFMQAGEEFCRSKYGVKNSYNAPDETNKLDWTRLLTHGTVADYYKGMLQIRHAFSGFTKITTRNGDNWNPNGNNYKWLSKKERGVSTLIVTNDVKDEWNKVAVIMNNDTSDATVDLSKYDSSWVILSDGNTAGLDVISTSGGNVKVAGKSVVVAVPKDTYDQNIDKIKEKLAQSSNTAPTISIAQTSIETTPGQKVEFEVKASDKDGDTVTLTASGLPEGATFENGTFTWESAKKGEYTVTFTASDGKDKTTKTVTIKVTSASEALDRLIAEVEVAGFTKDTLTETVWNTLQDALKQAKEVAGKDEASADEITKAVTGLQSAYDAAKGEKEAREALESYVKEADTSITNANDSNDETVIADAKAVLKEAETLLKNVATKQAYDVAKSNLEDSVNALAIGSGKSSIHVSASKFSSVYAYAWTGTGTSAEKLLGGWPGTKLTEKDSDGNYVIELDNVAADSKFNLIISDGAKSQTKDIENVSGKVTVTVDANSCGSKDGNTLYGAKATSEATSATKPELTKKSLEIEIKNAETYNEEEYTVESFAGLKEALDKASTVNKEESATQVEINQATRALRAAILAMVRNQTTPDKPTATPTTEVPTTPVVTPTSTPDDTIVPTASVLPMETTTPVISATPTGDVTNTTEPGADPTSPVATETPNVGGTTPTPTAVASTTPTVAPTSTPIDDSDLRISKVKFSPSLCQVVNKTVTFSVMANGGIGNYKYKYDIYLGTKKVASKAYSGSRTLKYTPKKAGTYRFVVSVKDEDGIVRTVSKKYVVVSKKLAFSSIKVAKTKVKKNKKITVTAKAIGGKKAYRYNFAIINAKGKIVKKSNYTTKTSWTWKATKIGTYRIRFTVKDATGTVVTRNVKKIKVVK